MREHQDQELHNVGNMALELDLREEEDRGILSPPILSRALADSLFPNFPSSYQLLFISGI